MLWWEWIKTPMSSLFTSNYQIWEEWRAALLWFKKLGETMTRWREAETLLWYNVVAQGLNKTSWCHYIRVDICKKHIHLVSPSIVFPSTVTLSGKQPIFLQAPFPSHYPYAEANSSQTPYCILPSNVVNANSCPRFFQNPSGACQGSLKLALNLSLSN